MQYTGLSRNCYLSFHRTWAGGGGGGGGGTSLLQHDYNITVSPCIAVVGQTHSRRTTSTRVYYNIKLFIFFLNFSLVVSRRRRQSLGASYVTRTRTHTNTSDGKREKRGKRRQKNQNRNRKKTKHAKRREENKTDFDDGARAMRSGANGPSVTCRDNNISPLSPV